MSIVRITCLVAATAGTLAGSLAISMPAYAQGSGPSKADRAAARQAYDKGTQAYERGLYVEALDYFVKANAIIPSVQALFWIARCQDEAGRPEAALEAYEAVVARADYATLKEDKQVTVRQRMAALKAQLAPAPAEPAPEPQPEETAPIAEALPPPSPSPSPSPSPPPPPPVSEPPALDDDGDVLPERNLAELGLMFGTLFVTKSNNLAAADEEPVRYKHPAWQIGARAAFFPEKVFGVEAEYAHGFGSVKEGGASANFDVVRGHLIGQMPSSRAVPFALLGAGMLHAKSNPAGADTDFMFEAGVGLKVMATKLLVPRFDARVGMTQKKGGGFTDGIAFHPELLLGMSFVLGR